MFAHLLLSLLVFTESLKNVNSVPVKVTSKGADVTQATEDTEDNPETLEEPNSNQVAVVEGDIMLNGDRSSYVQTWPTLNIPYTIDPELAHSTKEIQKALSIVSQVSCVTFHNRTTEDNYLYFKKSKGCASYVGFIGGKQALFLGPSCELGNIVHEIFHALGVRHEHTRTDRDKYVKILFENIKEGKESNFYKKEFNTFNNPYDFGSIMHYGSHVFSRNGLPTITTNMKDEDKYKVKYMGQRFKVTKLDSKKLRDLYHCVSKTAAKNQDVLL